ncbi:MAG: cyclase family protein, partial [Candidatus Hydrogenedentes bacterium]|nr:cyclase family protein [Candidatus Hydrogenedentota bacterium]
SNYPVNGPFNTRFVALGPDAAQRLVDDNVRMVGIDYLSVAPYEQPNGETHHRLLERNVTVVEGLCLQDVPAGTHLFFVFPLRLVGADGAPCRALIGLEESEV